MLPICLDEIDECRPFFMAILGHRYGWVPEAIDNDLLGATRGSPDSPDEASRSWRSTTGLCRPERPTRCSTCETRRGSTVTRPGPNEQSWNRPIRMRGGGSQSSKRR